MITGILNFGLGFCFGMYQSYLAGTKIEKWDALQGWLWGWAIAVPTVVLGIWIDLLAIPVGLLLAILVAAYTLTTAREAK